MLPLEGVQQSKESMSATSQETGGGREGGRQGGRGDRDMRVG